MVSLETSLHETQFRLMLFELCMLNTCLEGALMRKNMFVYADGRLLIIYVVWCLPWPVSAVSLRKLSKNFHSC